MRSYLRLERVSFSYSEPVFTDLTLSLDRGWTGVVGPNGAGKTTLLRLLEGTLQPDRGRVLREPAGGLVLLCPQRVEHRTGEILAFAESSSPSACEWRGHLALDPTALGRWESLSPGERKRWQIGAALALEPALLLLDEPTNHLDAEGRAHLIAALSRFDGVGVVVSHDRALLDGLSTATARVEHGRVSLFPGPYSREREARDQELRQQEIRAEQARSHERREQRRVADLRRARAEAERQTAFSARSKGRHDNDARSMGSKFRTTTAEATLGRQVAAANAHLERATRAREQIVVDRSPGRELRFEDAPARKPVLLQLQRDTLRVGERVLLRDLDLCLRRGERVWLTGPNGAGKTTLIAALLAEAHLPAERLLSLPQELSESEERQLLDEVRALPAEQKGRLLQRVAALGVEPARLHASQRPSPGEARKLAIALGLAREAWLLVLDEPTNHLDLPGVERLERALSAYPGAVLLVSHDPTFAARVTDSVWALSEGRLSAPGAAVS